MSTKAFAKTVIEAINIINALQNEEKKMLRTMIINLQLDSTLLLLEEFFDYDLYSNGTYCISAKKLNNISEEIPQKLTEEGIIREEIFNNTKYYCINS